MANSYRMLMERGRISKEKAEKEIRVFTFLADCDQDDICILVDSGAFNDIIRAFFEMAVDNADIDEKSRRSVLAQLRWMFSEKQAKEILERA